MGKKSGGSAPAAPDPAATAAAQSAANKETAIAQQRLNMINQVTPWGTVTYSPTGETFDGIDQYQQTLQLSPEQMRLLGLEQGISEGALNLGTEQIGRISDALSGPLPTINDETRQRVEDALFERSTAQLDPVYDAQLRRLETQLVNQGFSRGSEGYNREIENFRRSRGNAYQDALNDAIAGGGAEQSRLFGLETAARAVPVNELAALLGTSGGVIAPQTAPPPQTGVAPTDVIGPTALSYQGALNAYGERQANQRAQLGSIFGLGSSTLGGWAYGGFK